MVEAKQIARWEKGIYIIVLSCIALVGFITTIHSLSDPDAYWHIATGRYIVTNHSIPKTDIFSWYGIKNHLKWVNHEWLYDVIIYSVFSFFGLKGTIVFTGITFSFLISLIYIYTKVRTNNNIISLVAAIIAVIGLNSFMVPRPQTLSYNLFVLTLILLEKEKWWYTIPIVVLGVNLHGGFSPMYIIVIAMLAWRKKTLLIPAAIASMIINPYGITMLTYPIQMEKCTQFYKYITEWIKTPLIEYKFALALYIIIIISMINNTKKWKIEDSILALLISVLTLTAVRQLVFLYIFIFPLLSPYILDGSTNIYNGIKKKVHIKFDILNKFNLKRFNLIIILMPILIISFVALIIFDIYRVKNLHQIIPPDIYPTKAINFMRQNNIKNYFNEYNIGGYLIFENLHPLVDGRTDIFVPMYNKTDIFEELVKVERRESNYKAFLDKYNVKYIIIDKDFYLNNFLLADPKFKIIYDDENFFIYQYLK